jgi:hypothetical protein
MNVKSVTRTRFGIAGLVDKLPATRISVTTVGVIFGLSGMNHGFFEFLQGNKPTNGLVIHAIGPEQRFWELGTEDAFAIIPNFMISGMLSMLVGVVIVIWSLRYIETKHGPGVFIGLFTLLFLVGGGIGQIAFFIPAWLFSMQLNKPLKWWQKVLPRRSWDALSVIWMSALILSTVSILIGIELAVFGYWPGITAAQQIQNMAGGFVLASVVLYIVTFIAGIGHDLKRLERNRAY